MEAAGNHVRDVATERRAFAARGREAVQARQNPADGGTKHGPAAPPGDPRTDAAQGTMKVEMKMKRDGGCGKPCS
jgi:hypothetical protein